MLTLRAHGWFNEYTIYSSDEYGVPPGFLVGGPNAFYTGPTSPPAGEPNMKAYRNWNGIWPDARLVSFVELYLQSFSWEVTENAIYYQAYYVFTLAHFTTCAPPAVRYLVNYMN